MAILKSKDTRLYYRCAYRRRLEASILIEAAQPTGAVYLARYVVECMLKSLIIKTQSVTYQGDLLVVLKRIGHNIQRLLEFYLRGGGSRPPAVVVRALMLAGDWSTQIRYDPKEIKAVEAFKFLKAVDEVYRWVDGRL